MKGSEDKAPKHSKSEVSEREEAILEFWNKNEIFKKTLEKESPNGLSAQAGNFVFYDGPPFATGRPHYGHILPGTIKDLIPRYQTMKGKRVLRKWGWDCHGLPIENLIEKELGLKTKKDIEDLGVEKFNLSARGAVLRYADDWKKVIPRSGRWVDMDNDYRTMDSSYTESVWWSFKTLYDKGLVYEGFKSMLLCPRCETTLSNFEVNLGYKDITDISVYVKFELVDEPGVFVLAWTTTPWTLPGNVALAINKDFDYVKVKKDDAVYILAKDLAEKVLKDNYEVLEEFSGKKLLGKTYKPIFEYYNKESIENIENAWKIYHGDFVTTEAGTGVVHTAPAFGEDDMNLGRENNLPFIQHINNNGTFKDEVADFAGKEVKPKDDHQKTDIEIIKYLAKNNILFAKEKIVHSYPHCWRCGTPLLNYASTSWFIKVTEMKDRLVEVNKKVSWTPKDIGEGRFGKWLEGARDWAISRSRYWGAPLPVWQDEKGEKLILGSIDDLKEHIKSSGNRYFVMRHGESESNVKGFYNSDVQMENPLTDKGKNQVIEKSEFLKEKNIDFIITSPLQRTQETAKLVSEILGLASEKIIIDEGLREWNFGKEFEGQPMEKHFKAMSESGEGNAFKVKDGESNIDLIKRGGEFIYNIDKKYSGKNILIISHGGINRSISLISEGFSIKNLDKTLSNFKEYDNAEVREVPFVKLPHNEMFELDLHRPYIDEVEVVDEDGNPLKRIPEIFDTWYDSGSMPFAQEHYPFENKDLFLQKDSPFFPADFIAEGLDQTRGWFYTLLVLSVGLFDKSPYEKVIVNGLVLAEDGRKMSKSLNNYPDIMEIIDKYGADSLRFYLMSSPLVKAEEFNFSAKGVEDVYKKLIQKLYNVVSFYEMYPTEGNYTPKETVLDKWILSKLGELLDVVTKSLDKYEIEKAARPIMDFVDDLSTWYLRRSRDRFKSEDPDDRIGASHYTALVLRELSKIMAPFTPFIAEEVYRRARGVEESVHLESWSEVKEIDNTLLENMQKVRDVVTKALELRQKAGLKVRQPLKSLTITEQLEKDFLDIISDEVNVKEVLFGDEIKLDTEVTEDLRKEGVARDIIRGIQDARKEEKLSPSDFVQIKIHGDSKIEEIFKEFEEMIKSPTQISETEFVKSKQKYTISTTEGDISISLLK